MMSRYPSIDDMQLDAHLVLGSVLLMAHFSAGCERHGAGSKCLPSMHRHAASCTMPCQMRDVRKVIRESRVQAKESLDDYSL